MDSKPKSIPADLGMNLFAANECDVNMNNVSYRQAIGCLMFLSNVTHPDIAFILNYLSRLVLCFNKQHWYAVKNVLRYLSAIINLGILYDGTIESVYPEGFSDSDYAGDLIPDAQQPAMCSS